MVVDAQSILELTTASEYGNVFCISAPMRGAVSFQSQQQRAFNLIWALAEAKDLRMGATICVVGGGLAGMSAALAASRCGYNVTLIEGKPELMHLQRGSQLRYIHPGIHKWPDQEANRYTTDLPLLNWGASSASEVAETILWQWKNLGGVRVLSSTRVVGLTANSSKVAVRFKNEKESEEHFDIAIVSIGFGIERTCEPVPFSSYWSNDNYGRPIIVDPVPRKYVVTGCGDGGLIDVVRLCLADFDQPSFTKFLLTKVRDDIKDCLVLAEKEASGVEGMPGIADELSRRMAGGRTRDGALEDIKAELLEKAYSAIDVTDLLKVINGALRKDREILLTASSSAPYLVSSSIFNRFAYHLMFRSNAKLKYLTGRTKVTEYSGYGSTAKIQVVLPGLDPKEFDVNEIVVRHGCDGILHEIFPANVVDRLTDPDNPLLQKLADRQYPERFLESGVLQDMKRQVLLDHAAGNLNLLAQNIGLSDRLTGAISLNVADGKVSYIVSTDPQAGSELHSFEDINVSYQQSSLLFSGVTTTSKDLIPGLGIGYHSASELKCCSIIGCFVTGPIGPGFLSIAGSSVTSGMTVTQPEVSMGLENRTIGRVSDQRAPVSTEYAEQASSPYLSSNWFAGTLIQLDTSVKFSNRIAGEGLPQLTGTRAASQGLRVFLIGDGLRVSWGTISSIDAFVQINLDGPCWFHQVFIIEPSGTKFAAQADTGALIVTEAGEAVGLLLGSMGRAAVGVPLERLLDIFNCKIIV